MLSQFDFRNRKLAETDSEVLSIINKETERKEYSLELIPSENHCSESVLEAIGSIMTDKYCEGYPGKRYYGGCAHHDEVENLAIDRCKKMFGVEHANVQPHSGSNANMAVAMSFLKPGDTILGPRLDHGGHLTHGSPVNYSGKLYNVVSYGVHPDTNLFYEEEVARLAEQHKPKLIICGATAYSRQIDWQMFRKVGDSVGAVVMADVAHYAGLIVGGAYQSPVPFIDVITSTTHKTLRGPRGGIIFGKEEQINKINKAIFPGIQGGPLMNHVAAKAVAFGEALTPEFKAYAHQVVKNAKTLADALIANGLSILTGGTDSHVMIIDLRPQGLKGNECEVALEKIGITVNKNTIPNDPNPPAITSGIRLGTPCMTSRGFVESDMGEVADCITTAILNQSNEAKLKVVREKIIELCKRRPLFPYRLK